MPYKSIQNVTLNQGVLDRMLGISTVIIQNAAQGGGPIPVGVGIPGQPLERGQELVETLNKIVASQGNPAGMGL